jgi:Aspartyl/Asparaginyl beta-hydroxylase
MNYGAILFKENFLSGDEINEAATLAKRFASEKQAVHQDGKYAGMQWFQVNLDPNWGITKKILSELNANNPELLVFYYLEPGAKIHPHRDLSGASLSNRIRFHVPIVTNPDVKFMVDHERVKMNPGELWCLDTSYLHAVANDGSESRVHIVVECGVNASLRQRLPNNLQTKLHTLGFFFTMAGLLAKSLVLNSVKDPRYLMSQIAMIVKYVGWRFLKIGSPK